MMDSYVQILQLFVRIKACAYFSKPKDKCDVLTDCINKQKYRIQYHNVQCNHVATSEF